MSEVNLNKLREKTTVVGVKEALTVIAEKAQAIPMGESADENGINDAVDNVKDAVLEVLVKNNVPRRDFKFFFESMLALIFKLQDKIDGDMKDVEAELLARTIQQKNPSSSKFDVDYSTWGDYMKAMIDLREKTGGLETYYNLELDDQEDDKKDDELPSVQEEEKEA